MTAPHALIQQIHQSPCNIVMALSGIDNDVISDLISGENSEQSILEAVLLPNPQKLTRRLGHQTEDPISPESALAKAEMAYRRSEQIQLTPGKSTIGLSCLVESLHHQQGRKFRCYLATQTKSTTRLYTLTSLEGAEFETEVNTLILKALLNTGPLNSFDYSPPQEMTFRFEEEHAEEELQKVWNNQSHILWSLPNGSLKTHLDEQPKGILSGSFNPLHEGHRHLRDAAEEWLENPVYYEMPITNAEKLPLDFLTIHQRRHQFKSHPLALTNAPTFVQKVEFLRNVTFVVGADTAERIVQPRFYGGNMERMRQALETIRQAGCRFLVAGRKQGKEFLTLSDISIPNGATDLFEEFPESAFRRDLSSTEKRKKRRQ